MFWVADTPVLVVLVTALLTEMPGYAAAKDAVTAAPLLDSAVDTDAVETAATVGLNDGAIDGLAVGLYVGLGTLQAETVCETKLPLVITAGAVGVLVGLWAVNGRHVAIAPWYTAPVATVDAEQPACVLYWATHVTLFAEPVLAVPVRVVPKVVCCV